MIHCPRCKKTVNAASDSSEAWDEAEYRGGGDHYLVHEEKMYDYPHENPNDCIRHLSCHLSEQLTLLNARLERLESK